MHFNGTSRTSVRKSGPNLRLLTLMNEAGLSRKALGRKIRELSAQVNRPVSTNHTDVGRWLNGVCAPRPFTADMLALALSRELGRTIKPEDMGFAGEPSPAPAMVGLSPQEAYELARRVEQLSAEVAALTTRLQAAGLTAGPIRVAS
ncbi:hypothetical protein Tcur_3947 [Thermomonospora curvata DSM 43183]|uniref:Uncharacterized protein n=2 Tax=Thermomonospora curvata TaxID=2020 RepID=D1AE50_THECD|nr:hypothetical protein Tcur_3947 [Thermomonospora curvata DSM 43183]